jgi:hypothetical protein
LRFRTLLVAVDESAKVEPNLVIVEDPARRETPVR